MLHRFCLSLLLLFPLISLSQEIEDQHYVFSNFERNYDSLLHQYYMQHNQRNMKTRFEFQSESIPFHTQASATPDSIFAKRLSSLPTTIAMPFNPLVRRQIEYYIDKIGPKVEVMLGLSKYYFPLFESILDRHNIPLEVKNLVIVESALNPLAISPVGATGLWQFMYSTGRMYDLRINSLVDERRDPIKSTESAARYLKDLYDIYHDWTLALAAYNCGPGNVNKAIQRSNGKRDFWEIYPLLPKETRGYIPAFIAANYIISFHQKHNLHPADLDPPVLTDTIMISENIHLGQIGEVLQIDIDHLREINPQYTHSVIPGASDLYALNLPNDYVNLFLSMKDSIFRYKHETFFKSHYSHSNQSIEKKKVYHTVAKGENWAKIASRYGVNPQNLKRWNKLRTKYPPVGRRLVVYQETPVIQSHKDPNTNDSLNVSDTLSPTQKEAPKSNRIVHTVRRGDTVYGLAKQYRVSSQHIMQNNNLKGKNPVLRIGQKLVITQ